MPYEIIFKPEAENDFEVLRKYDAAKIGDEIEAHLTYEPRKESKARIKKLRERGEDDYRLRVEEFRVFYTVDDSETIVWVLRILHKDDTDQFYGEA